MLWYVLLFVAAFLAGIINTIAGGGSFLTLPALMMFGLEPKLANGTNRVAVLFSSASAAATFDRNGHLDRKAAFRLAIQTLLGVPAGSLLAIYLPANAFEPLLGVVFLVMAGLMASNPKRFMNQPDQAVTPRWWTPLVFFSIGVYVGFIQAGMGILLLLAMGMLRSGDLVSANGIKNLIAFFVTLTATIMFALHDMIQWAPGLVMAAGNVLGGFAGAKLAIQKGNRLIFGVMICVMIATGVKLIVSRFA